jgi:hypothetical protein
MASTTVKAYAHLSGDTVKAGVQKATDALQHAAGVELESNIEVRLIDRIKKLSIEEQKELLEQLEHG